MSSVDTRLKDYFNFSYCFHRIGGDSWVVFIQTIADKNEGIASVAANRFLSRHGKDQHVSHAH